MNKPFWIEIGMLGIKSRGAALAWFYLSIILSLLCPVMIPFGLPLFAERTLSERIVIGLVACAGGLLASLWYWFCIKWMDENRGWTR
jgi:hypothetical protein